LTDCFGYAYLGVMRRTARYYDRSPVWIASGLGLFGRLAVFFVVILPLTILLIGALIAYWYVAIPLFLLGVIGVLYLGYRTSLRR
jgi:hypothetical protein